MARRQTEFLDGDPRRCRSNGLLVAHSVGYWRVALLAVGCRAGLHGRILRDDVRLHDHGRDDLHSHRKSSARDIAVAVADALDRRHGNNSPEPRGLAFPWRVGNGDVQGRSSRGNSREDNSATSSDCDEALGHVRSSDAQRDDIFDVRRHEPVRRVRALMLDHSDGRFLHEEQFDRLLHKSLYSVGDNDIHVRVGRELLALLSSLPKKFSRLLQR